MTQKEHINSIIQNYECVVARRHVASDHYELHPHTLRPACYRYCVRGTFGGH